MERRKTEGVSNLIDISDTQNDRRRGGVSNLTDIATGVIAHGTTIRKRILFIYSQNNVQSEITLTQFKTTDDFNITILFLENNRYFLSI